MTPNDAVLRPSANNFTAVRLALASLVIVTHTYWMIHGVGGVDELSGFLGAPVSVFAVDGFFFLSGFLVYPSLIRLQKSSHFVFARFARLWPGLALAILITVAGGAFITSAHGLAYLSGDTARFIATNLTFLWGSFNLTGVQCGSEPCPINGSLWTLPWEARCYAVLAILGILGLAKPEFMKKVVLPATLLGAIVFDVPAVQHLIQQVAGKGAVYQLTTADRLWPLFALGAAAWLFRERLKLSWLVLGVLFLLMLGANRLGVGLHVRALFTGYLVLCLGLLTAARGAVSGRWPDYSYGMYIYAFPVMMVVHGLWPTTSHAALAIGTFFATVPFAALSWHLVEKRALDAVKQGRARRAAVGGPPPGPGSAPVAAAPAPSVQP